MDQEQADQMQGPEWQEWKHHPQTRQFLKLLYQDKASTEQAWSNREYMTPDLNYGALGSQRALMTIIYAIEQAGGTSE